jgi:immunity protein 8 of polymorphic toxin system
MIIELKDINSPDLDRSTLPDDPSNCLITCSARIGPRGADAAEIFAFEVVTPQYLSTQRHVRWGRGLLLMDEFSWREVERMLNRLVARIRADTWGAAAAALSKELMWEFDDYQP